MTLNLTNVPLRDLYQMGLLHLLIFEILSCNRVINIIQQDFSLFKDVDCLTWIFFI